MFDHNALSEIPSRDRIRMIGGLGRLAAELDLDRDGPASRFLASVAANLRAAEREEFLRLAAFEDAINEPRGELLADGESGIPHGWQLT